MMPTLEGSNPNHQQQKKVKYTKHQLSNGLKVILHEDHNTPLVSVNILYNVGARDEDPSRTGFAHLFEHLMFGGTEQVPDFDLEVDRVGGESNAFTNNDYTNYYITLPAQHLDTALRLEADRMRQLAFSPRSLEVQQHVVTEEYHQRYMGQPYGDVWLLLRPLAYTTHPYRWCTIGADIKHVAEATLDDVRNFFFRYYRPNNAILSIAGDIHSSEALALVEQHFGAIPMGQPVERHLPSEPAQTEERRLVVERQVPSDALYMAFPMPHRLDPDFPVYDLISDVLSNGRSSRLYLSLVKDRQLFTEINAYVTGDCDPGLFVVSGKLTNGTTHAQAQQAVWEVLQSLVDQPVAQRELDKVINKFESTFVYSQYKAIDRAMSLCYFEWLGHIEWVDDEPLLYRKVVAADLQRVAARMFRPCQCSTLEYHAQR